MACGCQPVTVMFPGSRTPTRGPRVPQRPGEQEGAGHGRWGASGCRRLQALAHLTVDKGMPGAGSLWPGASSSARVWALCSRGPASSSPPPAPAGGTLSPLVTWGKAALGQTHPPSGAAGGEAGGTLPSQPRPGAEQAGPPYPLPQPPRLCAGPMGCGREHGKHRLEASSTASPTCRPERHPQGLVRTLQRWVLGCPGAFPQRAVRRPPPAPPPASLAVPGRRAVRRAWRPEAPDLSFAVVAGTSPRSSSLGLPALRRLLRPRPPPWAPPRMETLWESSLLPSHPCGPPGGNLCRGEGGPQSRGPEASPDLRTDWGRPSRDRAPVWSPRVRLDPGGGGAGRGEAETMQREDRWVGDPHPCSLAGTPHPAEGQLPAGRSGHPHSHLWKRGSRSPWTDGEARRPRAPRLPRPGTPSPPAPAPYRGRGPRSKGGRSGETQNPASRHPPACCGHRAPGERAEAESRPSSREHRSPGRTGEAAPCWVQRQAALGEGCTHLRLSGAPRPHRPGGGAGGAGVGG